VCVNRSDVKQLRPHSTVLYRFSTNFARGLKMWSYLGDLANSCMVKAVGV